MKKILIWTVMILFAASLAGCAAKEKMENEVGEAIGEKIVESAGDVKVDNDGEKMTIKGEDGEVMTLGGGEWPENKLIKNIPEFKKGTVISVVDSESAVMVGLEEVKKDDFVQYLEDLKKDYAENAMQTSTEEAIYYYATNDDGIGITITYGCEDETLIINIAKEEE